jgi:hypothetical protein
VYYTKTLKVVGNVYIDSMDDDIKAVLEDNVVFKPYQVKGYYWYRGSFKENNCTVYCSEGFAEKYLVKLFDEDGYALNPDNTLCRSKLKNYLTNNNVWNIRNVCYFHKKGYAYYKDEYSKDFVRTGFPYWNSTEYYLKSECFKAYPVGNSQSAYYSNEEKQEHPEYFYECPFCHKMYYVRNYVGDIAKVCHCQEVQIYSYHSWDGSLEFKKTETEINPDLYYGFEIETTGPLSTKDLILKDLFHLEYDCSIATTGYEIISQPCTWNYLLENKERINTMFENLKANGQSADDNSCGLHIHVSKSAFTNRDAINRFVGLIHGLRYPIQTYARRKGNSYCQYVKDMKNPTRERINSIPKDGHDVAVNCGKHSDHNNSDTIEVRIFKSTLDIDILMASIELVKNLVEVANNEHKMIVSFNDLVYGTYVPSYVANLASTSKKFYPDHYVDFGCYNISVLKARLDAYKELNKLLNNPRINMAVLNRMNERSQLQGGIQ